MLELAHKDDLQLNNSRPASAWVTLPAESLTFWNGILSVKNLIQSESPAYFSHQPVPVRLPEHLWILLQEANPERTYRAVLANFGLWWWHRYSPVCAPSSLIRVLLDHLRCKRDSPMPIPLEEGIDPFDCDWKTALRNLGLQVTNESFGNGTAKDVVKGRCIKHFPGRIVYRSITGKFDDHNMCTEGYKHVFDVGEVRCPLLPFKSPKTTLQSSPQAVTCYFCLFCFLVVCHVSIFVSSRPCSSIFCRLCVKKYDNRLQCDSDEQSSNQQTTECWYSRFPGWLLIVSNVHISTIRSLKLNSRQSGP
jgi:hypothetical protein